MDGKRKGGGGRSSKKNKRMGHREDRGGERKEVSIKSWWEMRQIWKEGLWRSNLWLQSMHRLFILNGLRYKFYFQSHLCIEIVSVCTGVCTCTCALVPAVIFSIVVFALHAYGIFRLVASHLSPSHLTHLLPMSECLCACPCMHLWSDTSLCTPSSLTAVLPRSYLQRFPLAAPACQCAVSGKIAG